MFSEDDSVEVPITNELDLHTFRPSELSELLPAYFDECISKEISRVRVIHGKGTGSLREGTHRLLDKLPQVNNWTYPASASTGSWGATWVELNSTNTSPNS